MKIKKTKENEEKYPKTNKGKGKPYGGNKVYQKGQFGGNGKGGWINIMQDPTWYPEYPLDYGWESGMERFASLKEVKPAKNN